jgi:hypothetical protein
MQFRIGDRDPVSGLYDVIYPDGSHTRNGIKIFNSAHEFGDVVLATQRSDGMMILDGVKATLTEVVTNSFSLGGFGEKPVGYLAGQVFNNEDEVILPVVSVKFAPGSPTSLAPNAGSFVVRISIDRPQQTDLKIKCELTGTAPSNDYTYIGLDANKFATIPAGLLFKDVTITPISNTTATNETIIVKALLLGTYWIGVDNIATATISGAAVKPTATIGFAPGSLTTVGAAAGIATMRITLNNAQPSPMTVVIGLRNAGPTAPFGTLGGSIVGVSGAITLASITSGQGRSVTMVFAAGQTTFDIMINTPLTVINPGLPIGTAGSPPPGLYNLLFADFIRGTVTASTSYNIVTSNNANLIWNRWTIGGQV